MNAAELPIIIEGPDGSGKSTLAKKLCEELGREYRRPSQEVLSSTKGPGEGLVEWWNEQLALPADELAKMVYDRCFYISDPIYQMAQAGRHLLMDGDELARGIMRLWNVEPVMIFCLPPWDVQHSNINQDHRDRLEGVGVQMLTKVNNAYYAYYAMWANAIYDNVMSYDYTEEGSWEFLLNRLQSVR